MASRRCRITAANLLEFALLQPRLSSPQTIQVLLMRFQVQEDVPTQSPEEDLVVLVPSEWDDYGFRTQFTLFVASAGNQFVLVGNTKILASTYPDNTEYKRTATQFGRSFEKLDPDSYCSLGQDSDYYRRLGQISGDLGKKILLALNDVELSAKGSWWQSHPGFEDSLLRLNAAHLARLHAKALFDGMEANEEWHHKLRFNRRDGGIIGGPDIFDVRFDGKLKVPGRMNVIVGKNGTGKTSLLAGIASSFAQPHRDSRFEYRAKFSRILVLTFNPFDSLFLVPADEASEANVRFLGRRPVARRVATALQALVSDATAINGEAPDGEEINEEIKKKWTDTLLKAFPTPKRYLAGISAPANERETLSTLEKLRHDSEWLDMITNALEDQAMASSLHENPSDALDNMSAGQRALITLYAALFSNLDRRALVLIDEPENHLHPSLIARFVRTFNAILDQRRAYAIVATHSPVVVQETPSRFVTILERVENKTTTKQPEFETFGESIDNITQNLFDTDFRSSHWKHVLKELATEGYDVDGAAAEVSNKPLSLLARTYFAYQSRLSKA